MLPEHIFREYDIRGLAETELTDDVVRNIGQAFGTALVREGKRTVSVGHDHRASSERILKALLEGLRSTPLKVTALGLIPTPLLYFSVSHLGLDAGICITGSHNPPEYNGLKLHLKDRSFYGEEIQRLKQTIRAGAFEQGQGEFQQGTIIDAYQQYVFGLFHFNKRLKVVLDAGHGMGGLLSPSLLRSLGHEVIELYTNPDNTFPDHHPDPTVIENLKDLQATVLETKADIGIAFDGDADRIGVVDDQGNVVFGDKILMLYAREILKRKPGATIIGEVKCSKLLYDDIERAGGRPLMWKTGHSLIKAKMKECKAELADEMSGHMFFADRWLGFDDALYAACRMLEILDESDKQLSELLSDVPQTFATPEIRVECSEERKFQIVEQALHHFKQSYRVVDTDGARIEFDDGWGLVRASNTQPALVMRFEATSQARLAEITQLVQSEIEALGGVNGWLAA